MSKKSKSKVVIYSADKTKVLVNKSGKLPTHDELSEDIVKELTPIGFLIVQAKIKKSKKDDPTKLEKKESIQQHIYYNVTSDIKSETFKFKKIEKVPELEITIPSVIQTKFEQLPKIEELEKSKIYGGCISCIREKIVKYQILHRVLLFAIIVLIVLLLVSIKTEGFLPSWNEHYSAILKFAT